MHSGTVMIFVDRHKLRHPFDFIMFYKTAHFLGGVSSTLVLLGFYEVNDRLSTKLSTHFVHKPEESQQYGLRPQIIYAINKNAPLS
jgi:hypothetical protein